MLQKVFASVVLLIIVTLNAQAAGDAVAGKEKSAVCAACHGAEGISSIALQPNLAGQVPGYISAQLKAYKSGERANALMMPQASALSEDDMDDYRGGFAERGISACKSCHGPSGHGIPKNYPRVSAQRYDYLEAQLLAYKKGERTGYNEIMSSIAFGLSELQIKQLAAYMAGLN